MKEVKKVNEKVNEQPLLSDRVRHIVILIGIVVILIGALYIALSLVHAGGTIDSPPTVSSNSTTNTTTNTTITPTFSISYYNVGSTYYITVVPTPSVLPENATLYIYSVGGIMYYQGFFRSTISTDIALVQNSVAIVFYKGIEVASKPISVVVPPPQYNNNNFPTTELVVGIFAYTTSAVIIGNIMIVRRFNNRGKDPETYNEDYLGADIAKAKLLATTGLITEEESEALIRLWSDLQDRGYYIPIDKILSKEQALFVERVLNLANEEKANEVRKGDKK